MIRQLIKVPSVLSATFIPASCLVRNIPRCLLQPIPVSGVTLWPGWEEICSTLRIREEKSELKVYILILKHFFKPISTMSWGCVLGRVFKWSWRMWHLNAGSFHHYLHGDLREGTQAKGFQRLMGHILTPHTHNHRESPCKSMSSTSQMITSTLNILTIFSNPKPLTPNPHPNPQKLWSSHPWRYVKTLMCWIQIIALDSILLLLLLILLFFYQRGQFQDMFIVHFFNLNCTKKAK